MFQSHELVIQDKFVEVEELRKFFYKNLQLLGFRDLVSIFNCQTGMPQNSPMAYWKMHIYHKNLILYHAFDFWFQEKQAVVTAKASNKLHCATSKNECFWLVKLNIMHWQILFLFSGKKSLQLTNQMS